MDRKFVIDFNADTERVAQQAERASRLIDRALEGRRTQPDSGTACEAPLRTAQALLERTADDLRRGMDALAAASGEESF